MSNHSITARFDSVGGASGDMILSAFLDLGVNVDELISTVKQLDIEHFELVPRKVEQNGLHGTGIDVKIDHQGHHHNHRTFEDIKDLLEKSGIDSKIKDTSLQVFRKLAEAEASVHDTTPEKVTFHEVGATDSIIDIVGSCFCLVSLKIEMVTVGPLPVGRGTIQAAHGLLPVPVPATALLLRNHEIIQTEENTELVTPTGAALLSTWEKLLPSAAPALSISKTGHGFGSKKLSARPNVLRISLLTASKNEHEPSDCIVLESNIDDTIPELLGSLASRLFEAGALDVFFTSAQMKKQRPGTLLSVLVRPADAAVIKELIFRETTTFGIREYEVSRTTLARRTHAVQTRYGPVKIKIGTLCGEDVTWSPEYEDCARIAGEQQTPVRKVYEAALRSSPVAE